MGSPPPPLPVLHAETRSDAMKRWIPALLACLAACAYVVLLADGPAAEAAGQSEGAKLFMTKTCLACHGVDAKTPILPEYPKIAGQNAKYALQQMRDIKSGARNNGQSAAMKGIMHLVSDEENQILAEYVSTLEP